MYSVKLYDDSPDQIPYNPASETRIVMATFFASLSLIVILIGVLILENLLRVGMAEQTA